MIGARKGSPLAVGYGYGEMYLGSDAIALAPFTDAITYLEDGDWRWCTHKSVEIRDEQGTRVERAVMKSTARRFLVDKGNHRHFMAKEIHEQPEVVGHTLAHYLDMTHGTDCAAWKLPFDWQALQRISISACGTAFYAGLVAKYWFERFAACRSISISPPNSATARRRWKRATSRSSSRSRARPPTRSRRCATPRSTSTRCRS